MADAPDEAGLLEQCPFCDYSLRGLPVEHRCPECGQEIDRGWTVFGARSPWSVRTVPSKITNITVLVFMLILTLDWIHDMRTSPQGASVTLALGIIFMSAVVAISTLVELRKPASFIAVGPTGVMVYTRSSKRRQLYEWSRVEDVEFGGWGNVALKVDGRWTTIAKWSQISPEARRCVRCIRVLREQFG